MHKQSSKNNEHAAETLMRMLSDDTQITYVFYAGSHDEANQLVMRRKHKRSEHPLRTMKSVMFLKITLTTLKKLFLVCHWVMGNSY